jgi:hypothetical protein
MKSGAARNSFFGAKKSTRLFILIGGILPHIMPTNRISHFETILRAWKKESPP